MKDLYLNKELNYFSTVRKDIITFIGDKKDLKILEIGAGSGATLLELKKTGVAKSIYGYDIMDLVADKDNFDMFCVGNIETEKIPFEKDFFDIIIIADVLEHLIEPQDTLKKITDHLKDSGEIYISLPNFRNYTVFNSIFLKGDFKYAEQGILDKTHIRFFCKKNIMQIATNIENLVLIEVISNLKFNKTKKSILNKITLGVFEEFLSLQYFLKLKKIRKNDEL